MMNYIKSFFSWGGTSSQIIPIDEALQILKESFQNAVEAEQKTSRQQNVIKNNECFESKGIVTMVDERYGIIDKNLYFEHLDMSKFKIGMKVAYLAYKKDGETKISRILLDQDCEWDTSDSITARPIFERRIIGQVIGRSGRLVKIDTKPESHEIDLNKIETEFIPLIGDWLHLDAMVEVDEKISDLTGRILNIIKITPTLTKIETNAVITKYDQATGTGIINMNIYFNKDACLPGFIPMVKDKVSAELIESTQGRCVWRALKIVPLDEVSRTLIKVTDDNDVEELLLNKNGIIVSDKNAVCVNNIGDKLVFTIDVSNDGPSSQTIISCSFKTKDTQLILKKPVMENSIEIQPKKTLVFVLMCQAKYMGTTKELFVISFAGFKIARWIQIQVAPPSNSNGISYNKTAAFRNRNHFNQQTKDYILNNRSNILPGDRPRKAPSFIVNKLPMFFIPEDIANVFFNHTSANKSLRTLPLEEISKTLTTSISGPNYSERFHTLLFVEELHTILSMRRFSIPRASFQQIGEFLVLNVPDLMERRPSIIVGDKIAISNPCNPDLDQYEGFVHKTAAQSVFVKFLSAFHDKYKGEDYSVEFRASRTNFRRLHNAINVAVRSFGTHFLFPKSVPNQSTQIEFSCEDDSDNSSVQNETKSANNSADNINLNDSTESNADQSKPRRRSKYLQYARNMNKSQRSTESDNSDAASSVSEISSEKSDELPSVSETKPEIVENSSPVIRQNGGLKLEWFDKKLNCFQKAAVVNILKGEARPLPYLVFGPPGTGKTVTIIETILQILRLIPHSRILVTAPSNSAADLLALRLLESEVIKPGDLVRLVAYNRIVENKIPEKLVPYCMTGDIAREGTREKRTSRENGVLCNVQLNALGRHRITVATCMVSGVLYTMGLPKTHFTHFLIDEAGQALEPEAMIPLSLFNTSTAQIIMAGDPLQLGPYVFSTICKENGLGESYFERLINRFPYVKDVEGFGKTGGYDPRLVTRLVYNYRSLPDILSVANELFYNNDLIPTISNKSGREVDVLQSVRSVLPKSNKFLPPAIVFHGVRGENFQNSDSPSWFNPIEAGQVFYYVNDLYRAGLNASNIGIITPYIKQGVQIRSLLTEANMDLPKIGSVEEFQGQEFDVIILSTVRSNETGAKSDAKYGLGFISCPPRLNVAITRAQCLLIIIGNPHLLALDKYWRFVLLQARKNGGYVGCDFPNITE